MQITIEYYYLFIVMIGFISFLNVKLSYSLAVIIVPFFLLLLISTGFDYDHYKADYESGYFKFVSPFFFTSEGLTAEPLYKIYSAFVRVVTSLDFEFFLAINFILCISIFFSTSPFKNINAKIINYLFFLYLLPVILPTLFYFSPRSSISFFLVLGGFFLLFDKKLYSSLAFVFLGVMIHSQYLLFAFFLYLAYFVTNKSIVGGDKEGYLKLFIIGFLFMIFLKSIPTIISIIVNILSFLPSSSVAVSKLHYINSAREGLRVTTLLSLLVFPVLNFMLYVNQNRIAKKISLDIKLVKRLTFFLSICTVFGFCINFVFYNTPHLSGRLGRFSDYLLFSLLIPLSLISRFSLKTVLAFLFLLILLSPILYSTIYSIHDGVY